MKAWDLNIFWKIQFLHKSLSLWRLQSILDYVLQSCLECLLFHFLISTYPIKVSKSHLNVSSLCVPFRATDFSDQLNQQARGTCTEPSQFPYLKKTFESTRKSISLKLPHSPNILQAQGFCVRKLSNQSFLRINLNLWNNLPKQFERGFMDCNMIT